MHISLIGELCYGMVYRQRIYISYFVLGGLLLLLLLLIAS